MDDPVVREAISGLQGSSYSVDSEYDVQQLIAVKDDHAFLWNGLNSTLLVVALAKGLQGAERLQTFSLTDSPTYEVNRMVASPSCKWIALYGTKGVTCVALPRRSGKYGRFAGGAPEVTCRALAVAERFFLSQAKIAVQEVGFHPGAHYDNMVVILASDNFLRLYDLDADSEIPDQSYSLYVHGDNSNRLFADRGFSVSASLGETAVSFTFAPPIISSSETNRDDPAPNLYPLFLLHGNGNVYCLVTGLGDHKPKNSRLYGPLTMCPPSKDNLAVESCSILCLHPYIASPPVLVIANTNGSITHSVVLTQEQGLEDESDVRSQISDWSAASIDNLQSADLALYVYETVQLEIGLGGSVWSEMKENGTLPVDYPVILQPDDTFPARYFCSHKAGVHSVSLPIVSELARLAQTPENRKFLEDMPRPDESIVEHLICTQMSLKAGAAPVLGVAMHYPPATLICLLSDHKVQSLRLSPPYFAAPMPLLLVDKTKSTSANRSTSPLKARAEPFEQRIKAILLKPTKHPLMHAGQNGPDVSSKECLDFMTRSMQILRDEYLVPLEKVRIEVEKRAAHLESTKRSQFRAIQKLSQDKEKLREKAADLSERYESLQDHGETLTNRIEIVLQNIQRIQPMGSDAEIKMQRTLQDIQKKAKNLHNSLEQVKSKERYQFKQISQAKQRLAKHAPTNSEMGENQLDSIKEVLEQDGKEIAELVTKLSIAKKTMAF